MTTKLKMLAMEHFTELDFPKYATEGAAGMDVQAAVSESITLKKGERTLVPTGLKLGIPKGYEVQVRPRSGLAYKNGILVVNSPGTIDWDYRGELKIILANFGDTDFVIERGMRVAQIILAPVTSAEIEIVSDLDDTERGEGGFGSTGVKK